MRKLTIFVLSLLASTALVHPALAMTPSLSLTASGNNLTLYVSNADPYSQVTISYVNPGTSLPTTLSNTYWQTNSNGQFTTTLDASSYGIFNGANLYVTVGGTQSTWQPYNSSGSSGSQLSLSQTSVSLGQYQTTTVTAYNNFGNLYVSSNSNSSVATASINGNTITIYGASQGSTTLYLCTYSSSQCAYLYVTVTYGSQTGTLTLSQTSLSLTVGQSQSVTAYNSTGQLSIASNSNSGVATTSVNGSTVNVYGVSQGSSTISICSTYPSGCAYLYVTVTGGQTGQITFSNSAPSLTVGQSLTITIYTPYLYSGSYYLASNSNSSVVDASISSSSLYLYAKTSGSSSLQICQTNASSCGYVYVTVTGSQNTGNVWFSPASPNMYVGQSLAVSVNSSNYMYSQPSYSSAYYVSSNSNSSVVTASLSGTVLNLYASQAGTSSIVVCHSSLSFCGTLYVTVSGSGTGQQGLTFSNANPNLTVGQSLSITIYRSNLNYYGYGNYYVASNSNQSAVTASISGEQLSLYGVNSGNSTINICQTSGGQCGMVYVTVTGSGLTSNLYQNGQLINENGTIYIIYKNTKTPFTNASAFRGFGFKFENATSGQTWNLSSFGRVITTANDSHPWGSWIVDNGTVYFVHETGLIPIPSWETFLNNGGLANLIVQANTLDMQRPHLGLMVYSDTRLR